MKRRDFIAGTAAASFLARPGYSDQTQYKIRDLFNKDRSFSDVALAHDGEKITLTGFMAPPLKAEANFFVLTKQPMAVCPFCEPDTEWPEGILPIYTKRTVKTIPFNVRISATGQLEIGRYIDEETGFYSPIRMTNAKYG